MLEFNCEVALLQGAFLSVQQLHGNILISLDHKVIEKCHPFIKQAYNDILQIRKEESVPKLKAEHGNRKLVLGMLYSVLRNKYVWKRLNSEFQSFDYVYPAFNWNLLLAVISICNWNNHFVELVCELNTKILLKVMEEIIPLLDMSQTARVLILVEFLTVLMEPKKMCRVMTSEAAETSSKYVKLISEIIQLIPKHFLASARWKPLLQYRYLNSLTTCLIKNCLTLWKLLDINFTESQNKKLIGLLSESITPGNLEFTCSSLGETKISIHPEQLVQMKSFIERVIICAKLCQDAFLAIDWKSHIIFYETEKSDVPEKGELTSLENNIEQLVAICKETVALSVEKNSCITELFDVLHLIFQHINPQQPLQHKNNQNVTSEDDQIIDCRYTTYQEKFKEIVRKPDLIYHKDWIDCLVRNSDLVDKQTAWSLLLHIKEKNLHSPNVEALKMVILNAYVRWPPILQQQFIIQCLQLQSEEHYLKTKRFIKDLTALFNKLTNVILNSTEMKDLKSMFCCLVLQSPNETITAAVLHAINNDFQSDIIIELLLSIQLVCHYRSSCLDSTVLSKALKFHMVSEKLAEGQIKSFTNIVRLLLKTEIQATSSGRGKHMLEPVEFLHSCILPFLDQWIPEKHSQVTLLAIQLLQTSIEDSSSKTLKWLLQIRPCTLLCYLGTIVYQCKLVSSGDIPDWILLKTASIKIIKQIIACFFKCSSLITEKELQWLIQRLKRINETLLFYYVDLMEYYNLEINFRGSNNPLAYLLEFAMCNSQNALSSIPWFKEITKGFKTTASAQIISALVKVLPYALLEEWTNIMIVLKDYFEDKISLCIDLGLSQSVSQDFLAILRLVAVLEDTIVLCSAVKPNISYLLQCFNIIIRENTQKFLSNGFDDEDDALLPAELFIRNCNFLKRLPILYTDASYNLLLELAKMHKQQNCNKRRVNSEMIEVFKSLPTHDLQSVILQILV